jgi:hypothetical protein
MASRIWKNGITRPVIYLDEGVSGQSEKAETRGRLVTSLLYSGKTGGLHDWSDKENRIRYYAQYLLLEASEKYWWMRIPAKEVSGERKCRARMR